MLYAIIVFGLAVVWQLGSILSAVQDQQSELKKLINELQWHKDYTFAHTLMERLESHKKDIEGELQWHKDYTFAHRLTEELKSHKKDIVDDIVPELRKIVQELRRDR